MVKRGICNELQAEFDLLAKNNFEEKEMQNGWILLIRLCVNWVVMSNSKSKKYR
ncbi:MAG: hypothetical protein ACK5HU_03730 [Flavobacteriales bacterium]